MEAVNGFDEMLDYGNDCHMQNIRDRVALLGGQVLKCRKQRKEKRKKQINYMQNIRDRVALLGGQILECLNKEKKKKKTTCRTSELKYLTLGSQICNFTY